MKKLLPLLVLLCFSSQLFAAVFTVSSTADNDNGQPYSTPTINENTLRKCIRLALNGGPGPHTVNFNITGAAPFVINITAGTPLGNMYGSDITIDATTQPGWAPAQNPIVVLKGPGSGDAFQMNGGRVTIKGFIFQSFTNGILFNNSMGGNIFENNWFGVNSAGTSSAGNTIADYGIYIRNGSRKQYNLHCCYTQCGFRMQQNRYLFTKCRVRKYHCQ